MKRLNFIIIFFICNFVLAASAMPSKPNSIGDFNVPKMQQLNSKNIQSEFGQPESKEKMYRCSDGSFITDWTFDFGNGYLLLADMFHGKLVRYTLSIDNDKTATISFEEAGKQLGVPIDDLEKTFQTPSDYMNVCVKGYRDPEGKFKKINISRTGGCYLDKSPVYSVQVVFNDYPDECAMIP
jgi:hypothetical protein